MSRFQHRGGRGILACVVVACAVIIAGCGGGSGDSSNTSVNGVLTSTTGGRAGGTAVPGATIKAYIWPDTTTVVATTTTDSNGHYDAPLPSSAVGKDIVITAEKTSGTPPTTTRYSTLVCDLPANGVTNANIDPSTTVAAETVAKKAKDIGSSDISGTSFTTVQSEVKRNFSSVDSLSFTTGGTDIPANFGGGIPSSSSATAFLAGDATIRAALLAVNDTANSDVKQAKRIAQFLRDMASSVSGAGSAEKDSLHAAIEEQKTAISNSTQLTADFTSRSKFVGTMLTLGDGGTFSDDGLVGRPSGAYEQRVVDNGSGGTRNALVRTGNATDGRSWTVSSAVPGTTQGMVLTVTPASTVSAFGVTLSSPSMTVQVRKASDSALRYDGTLNLTKDSNSNITQAVVNVTIADQALTKAITVNGTLTGTPASGSSPTNPGYTQISFTGTLDSQFGTATVGNLVVQFFASSASGDVKQVQLTNLTLATTNSKPATASISSATIDFQAADIANGFPHSTPQHATLSGSLQASGHTLTLTNGTVTLLRSKPPFGNRTYAPSAVSGAVSYTSPVVTFTGNMNGTWDNAGSTGSSVASFPKASVHVVGTLTPKNGTATAVDTTLASDNTVVNNTVTATLTVTSMSYGSENLKGTAKEVFAVQNNVVQSNPTVSVNLTHSPSNQVVQLSGPANALSGTIKTSSGTTVAQIGNATDLQLGDLGSVTVIKYSDNTFETALSLLP